jgi:phage/plasmid-like protein (TIGR03299 family)
MTDVNEAFAAERIRQIANDADRLAFLEKEVAEGRAQKLPGGRFKITTGFDSSEVFSATGMAEHGLDLTQNGDVALYSRVPAWFGLGQIVPEGLHTCAEVLKASGLDYIVRKRADLFHKSDGDLVQVPGRWITYREDTEAPLGSVGDQYTLLQNSQNYGFLDELLDYGMVAETAGSFRDGRKTFISARAPKDLVIDPDGADDHTTLYVVITNSHDGSTPVTVMVTPWRPVCKNTERFALRDAKYKVTFRHTKNLVNKVTEAKIALNLTTDYADTWVKEETALFQTTFGDNDVDKLINAVWGELADDAGPKATTDHEVRRGRVHALWNEEKARVGANAFAAERAVTGFADHFAALKPRNDLKGKPLLALGQALLEEDMEPKKNAAHAKLMTLVTR